MALIRRLKNKVSTRLSPGEGKTELLRRAQREIRNLDDLEAYRLNLIPILDFLENEEIEHFVVSAPRGLSRPHIGLPSSALGPFLARINNSEGLPSVAEISGEGLERSRYLTTTLGPLHDVLNRSDRIQIVLYTPMINPATTRRFDSSHGCVMEVWRDEQGSLHSPDGPLRITGANRASPIPIEVFGMSATTYPPLGTPDMFETELPIDIVYLWVDGSDPDWRRKKSEAEGSSPEPESQIRARFRQFDELRYSLRSLARYAPWVNRVFLVTDSQRPSWLDETDTNLTVVDHKEILPGSALPTFNSHALTARLHAIPGLSEHFILFNDDILLGRPTRPERFINSNGTTRFFLSRHQVSTTPAVAHEHARLRTCGLVEEATGMKPTRLFRHTPHAMRRSLLEELEHEFATEWSRTVQNTFRTANDIVPSYLHHYVGYHRRVTHPASISYEYFALGEEDLGDDLLSYQKQKPAEVLCINDTGPVSVDANAKRLQEFFDTQYPHQSPYEVSD